MSIVKLRKVTFAGLTEDKERLLDDLQHMGCLQVVPLRSEGGEAARMAPSAGAREALAFLKSYPQRRRQMRDPARFDALDVERQVLEVRRCLQDLEQERDFLIRRIQAFQPWGDFVFPPPEQLGGLRLWFYPVPHKEMPKVETAGEIFEVVARDNRFAYVVVVAKDEPPRMPVPRVHLGAKPRKVLEDRLDEVELAIEDAEARRAYLTRWYELFRRSLNRLEDRTERAKVSGQTRDLDPVFGLHGWAPAESVAMLADYARRHGLYFSAEEPGPDDKPPTYLKNPSWLSAGEDLVNFYMTPGYRTWDPSGVVFLSFALFFGMILADAGYAAALGLLLLFYWKKLSRSETSRRYRDLGAALVGFGLVWGVLIGSYFGWEPHEDSFLGRLHVLNMSDANVMMGISIVIGCVHVILANLLDARRREHWIEGLAPVGWALVVAGGLALGSGGALDLGVLKTGGGGAIVLGLLLVLLFSAPFAPPLKRLLGGLHGLTEVSRAFGDVLSYLRLFALGMAGASLAVEFNHMAAGIKTALPGVGLFFAALVLILGHVLNIVLGIAAAVIHGLRLNVIEFFNWGLKEEGTLFRPFRRKES
jgi:V/A-type H+-transporting ATPase subunit I